MPSSSIALSGGKVSDVKFFPESKPALLSVRCQAKDAEILKYLAYDADKLQKLFENPSLIKTPIVRNGKKATVGYCPDVWKTWE